MCNGVICLQPKYKTHIEAVSPKIVKETRVAQENHFIGLRWNLNLGSQFWDGARNKYLEKITDLLHQVNWKTFPH